MNKLILVGNGFDLAHKLPTSYRHFIDDFWINFPENFNSDLYTDFVFFEESDKALLEYGKISNYNHLKKNLSIYCQVFGHKFDYSNEECKRKDDSYIFFFQNKFFQSLNLKNSIENWVDIENEYYIELKNIINEIEYSTKDKKEKLVRLNQDFADIRNLFEKYLFEKVVQKFDFNNPEDYNIFWQISEILKPIIVSKEPNFKNEVQKLSKEFSFFEDEKEILSYENLLSKNNYEREVFHSLLLSFNYTPTVFEYINYINKSFDIENCTYNFIHGQINSDKNKINFGFGDEMDDFYKKIENIGDNEYLKNFKSFQYSNTRNYHDLIRYIDSAKYQVYILGHSCGLSDRLLLNTIFEHENCRSIKIYYHQKEDGSDNYTDMVQNISRHFEYKQLMRRKIVNKTLSLPLPQNVRFKKKE